MHPLVLFHIFWILDVSTSSSYCSVKRGGFVIPREDDDVVQVLMIGIDRRNLASVFLTSEQILLPFNFKYHSLSSIIFVNGDRVREY